jgi:hypothetical protein
MTCPRALQCICLSVEHMRCVPAQVTVLCFSDFIIYQAWKRRTLWRISKKIKNELSSKNSVGLNIFGNSNPIGLKEQYTVLSRSLIHYTSLFFQSNWVRASEMLSPTLNYEIELHLGFIISVTENCTEI